jgi:hypothetical protein
MSYAETVKAAPLVSLFVRNAGKIAFVSGLIGSVLLTVNRSYMHGTPVADNMSLSGVALILSSLAMLPADRWPVFKRVAGLLGLAYAVLLIIDVWGKSSSAGVILSMVLSLASSLSLVLEQKHAKRPLPGRYKIVEEFRQAPVFWTSIACLALKPFYLLYGNANGEPLFVPLVIFLAIENLAVALMDNRVRRYFGMDAAAHDEALIA